MTNPNPNPNPAPDMAVEAVERQKFETWYIEDAAKAQVFLTAEEMVNLRDGNTYGEHRVMLNEKWAVWQACAALASPQEVAEGVDLRQIAVTAALNSEGRWSYLPNTYQEAATWTPHGWVIDAMRAAIAATRPAFTGNERNNPGPGTASSAPVAVGVEPSLTFRESDFESPVGRALADAYAEGWANCRDSEFSGEEAQHDAFNNSKTLSKCLDDDRDWTLARAREVVSAGAGGSVGAEPAHEFWELLHEWRDTVNTERADWIEHRFSELLRLATPAPSVPLGGGEGVVNAAIDAAIYSLRDAGFRVHRAAVIAAIEAFTKSMEVK